MLFKLTRIPTFFQNFKNDLLCYYVQRDRKSGDNFGAKIPLDYPVSSC